MIALATIVGAVLAALICRVGHVFGATNENSVNALRVVGGTLLFAMAAGAAAEGLGLGAVTAALCAVFVSVGGVDILRTELRRERTSTPAASEPESVVRDGDTMEMPVIVRDVA
jgi:hypothetical protein